MDDHLRAIADTERPTKWVCIMCVRGAGMPELGKV